VLKVARKPLAQKSKVRGESHQGRRRGRISAGGIESGGACSSRNSQWEASIADGAGQAQGGQASFYEFWAIHQITPLRAHQQGKSVLGQRTNVGKSLKGTPKNGFAG